MFPRKILKAPKRASRWRSQAHAAHVRRHECAMCGSVTNIEFAHVRLGSGAGISQKPDDWRAVSLCGGPDGCHQRQHNVGEATFWKGKDVEALIDFYCRTSPRAAQIREVRNG
jgi:hypothetical protein